MCGFTGWIDWTDDLTKQSATLEKMTGTLAKRGPDACRHLDISALRPRTPETFCNRPDQRRAADDSYH